MATEVPSIDTVHPEPDHPDREPTTHRRPTVAGLASRSILLASGLIFVVFAGVFFASSAPFSIPTVEAACGAQPPDVLVAPSATEIDRFLTGCGPEGRQAYRNLQLADLAYPAVFALFLASALVSSLTRLAPHRPGLSGLALLPAIGAGFDYLENAVAWRALAVHPGSASTNPLFAVASIGKNLAFWAAGALLLVSLGWLIVRAVGRAVQRRSFGRSAPLDPADPAVGSARA